MEHAADCIAWQAIAEDRPARFEEMAAEWRVWGYRLALKITGCPEAAEDAVQDALVRAFRHADKLRDPVAGPAWFRQIVVRCSMSAVPVGAALKDADPSVGASETEMAEAIQVRRTLARLRPDQRAILALAIGEGLSYAEVGAALGIGTGTVASRLHAAKEAFRRAWGDER